jgi:hypothetical protein
MSEGQVASHQHSSPTMFHAPFQGNAKHSPLTLKSTNYCPMASKIQYPNYCPITLKIQTPDFESPLSRISPPTWLQRIGHCSVARELAKQVEGWEWCRLDWGTNFRQGSLRFTGIVYTIREVLASHWVDSGSLCVIGQTNMTYWLTCSLSYSWSRREE